MSSRDSLIDHRFPRSARYHPDWVRAAASGGAHALMLTEWLAEALDLHPGMRVLDLACGRAASSIFLAREFGVQVWAADLWFDPSENWERINDAGVGDKVCPLRVEARSLPFAAEFFDAIVSIDAFMYFGTDDYYLKNLARFLKPGGWLGIAQTGLMREFNQGVPKHLEAWWSQDQPWCLHSADWWNRHRARSGILDSIDAETLPDGHRYWREWLQFIAPENSVEIEALEADQGRNLGYIRAVGQRRQDFVSEPPIISIPPDFSNHPLLRNEV